MQLKILIKIIKTKKTMKIITIQIIIKNNKNSNRKFFIFNNNKNICNHNYDQHNCDHCDFKIYCEFNYLYKHEHKRVND